MVAYTFSMQANYRNYREFHVYEKTVVLCDGRKIAYIGTISSAVIAAMTAQGVRIR